MIGENGTEEYSDEIMTKKREMEQQMQAMAVTDWAGIMMVCIHGQVENRIYGAIVNRCLEEPVSFCGLDQLVLKMDEICELVGSPMLSMDPRFLQEKRKADYLGIGKKRKKGRQKTAGWQNMFDILKQQAALSREVFEVQILFRSNATMQGRLRCSLSGKKYVSFRSALELLRMLKEEELEFCGKRGKTI